MIVYYFSNPGRLSEECLAEIVCLLPTQQQEIVAKMKNHRHRCEQVVAYLMLCHALEHNQTEINDSETTIKEFQNSQLTYQHINNFQFSILNSQLSPLPLWSFGDHGKPYINNYEGIHFNISHCNEAVTIAVSNRTIGIDIEGRRHFSDTLLQRAFNKEEQDSVKNSDDPEWEFPRIWTRKEAWFKHTGTGILMDHLTSTESDATEAGCAITTLTVATDKESGGPFWLSIAQKL